MTPSTQAVLKNANHYLYNIHPCIGLLGLQVQASYEFLVRFSSKFTIFMVSLMIAAKSWAWLSSASAVMLGSLTDSLLDISASLMNFLVLSYALRPADEDHRFGHGKAEALAGLGQAAFIAGTGCLLLFHGIERLINPVFIQHSLLGVWVSIFAIICTLLVVTVQFQVVKKTKSVAVKADSIHYSADILLNFAVLLSVLLSYYGMPLFDPISAIGVALYLMYNCWRIATESADHLMDKELPECEQTKIIDIVSSHDDVLGVHALRTRQSGKIKFIQLHLELDENLSLIRAHNVAVEVINKLKQEHEEDLDILIHQDPVKVKH